jgi:hypothetical protein
MQRKRLSVFLHCLYTTTATLFLADCDPAAITTLQVSTMTQSNVSSEGVHVSTEEDAAVVKIVTEVAESHGLACSNEQQALVRCFRRWDRNEEGHARSIQVWVARRNPNSIDISVMKWLTFHHRIFGRAILEEFTARLGKAFGPDAISRVTG